jgi:hypothetical protein
MFLLASESLPLPLFVPSHLTTPNPTINDNVIHIHIHALNDLQTQL